MESSESNAFSLYHQAIKEELSRHEAVIQAIDTKLDELLQNKFPEFQLEVSNKIGAINTELAVRQKTTITWSGVAGFLMGAIAPITALLLHLIK